ncbi:SDR family oxidoreductase [Rubricoccus marinus]|uniref:Short-chain dehydrogenase n=1 Tax=Rubricoccus marinus TaxID=716817 RepID=A0A259U099_9BACT|nr:SDR family oxidoreductase [Rubricoccus marinus]OZC03429.1 short-chain dehydrogenase [Rubricoccus marinus]
MTESYRGLFDLTGKVALVTGGSGLLGTHFCAGLAEYGASVAVVDLQEEAAIEAAHSLRERFGVRTVGVGCDVSDPAAVDDTVRLVASELGRVDILHNNAASKSNDLEAFFAPTEDYAVEEWRKIMSVNLDGLFWMARAVGRQMIAQGAGGAIVQTASIYGVVGPDSRIYEGSQYLGQEINTPAVYAASKGGVVSLTRYLATTWAQHGIRVNSLTPGGVESGQNEAFTSNYAARTPMGRMGRPEEMVGALIYLCSDASSYVTGQNLIVDGGWTAW